MLNSMEIVFSDAIMSRFILRANLLKRIAYLSLVAILAYTRKGPSDLTFDANADLKNEDPSVSISVTTLIIPEKINEMIKYAQNKSPLWQIVRLENEVKHLEKKLKAANKDKDFVDYN